MKDSLEEIQFEYDRLRLIRDTMDGVQTMRFGMGVVDGAVEWAGTWIGSRFDVVDLEGWQDFNASRVHEFDHDFARIYKKYWRRGATDPLVAFAWHYGRGVVSFGLNKKIRKGTAAMRTTAPPPTPTSANDTTPRVPYDVKNTGEHSMRPPRLNVTTKTTQHHGAHSGGVAPPVPPPTPPTVPGERVRELESELRVQNALLETMQRQQRVAEAARRPDQDESKNDGDDDNESRPVHMNPPRNRGALNTFEANKA